MSHIGRRIASALPAIKAAAPYVYNAFKTIHDVSVDQLGPQVSGGQHGLPLKSAGIGWRGGSITTAVFITTLQ